MPSNLTDTLTSTNSQTRAIGGSEYSNPLEGLADLGSNLMKAFSQNQSATRERGPTNNVALDEAAMGVFQVGTGTDLNNKFKTHWKLAERLQKAKDSGNLDEVTYDVKMTSMYYDMMQKHPNDAHEMLAALPTNIDHHLFRNMQAEDDRARGTAKAEADLQDKLATDAVTNGLAKATDPRDLRISRSQQHLAKQFEDKAVEDALRVTKANADLTNPLREEERKTLELRYINGKLSDIDQKTRAYASTYYDLLIAAGNDPERLKMLDAIGGQAMDGLTMFAENVSGYIHDYVITGTATEAAGGKPYVIQFDKAAEDRFNAAIAAKKEFFTALRNRPIEEQKRLLENLKLNSAVSSQKLFPSIQAVSQLTGMSTSQILTIAGGDGGDGMTAQAMTRIINEFSKGVDSTLENSAQAIAAATNRLEMPAANPDLKVSVPAVMMALDQAEVTSSQLRTNKFATDADRKATLTTFENYYRQIPYMLNNSISPSQMNYENGRIAIDKFFKTKAFDDLDAYEAAGGDSEYAELLRSQLTVAAANFSSGLITKGLEAGQFTYDPNTKFFVPKINNTVYANFGKPAIGRSGAAIWAEKALPQQINDESVKNTKLANDFLDFFDKVKDRTEVIPSDILESTSSNIRDFIAQGLAMPDMLKALSAKAKANVEPTSDQLFKLAADKLEFTPDLPDNWLMEQGMKGGGNPFDSEDSWARYLGEARGRESGGVNTARPRNENGTLDSSALGPDQFIDSTWLQFAQDEEWAQGKSRKEILDMRTDPAKSEQIMKQFTADNADIMVKKLDRKPLSEELHMAHFAGAEGASDVLQANPRMPIDKLLKAAKQAEPGDVNFRMFYKTKKINGKFQPVFDGEGKPIPLTAGEFKASFGLE